MGAGVCGYQRPLEVSVKFGCAAIPNSASRGRKGTAFLGVWAAGSGTAEACQEMGDAQRWDWMTYEHLFCPVHLELFLFSEGYI